MMTIALTALLIVVPVLACIPTHMTHAAVVTPVHYNRYDYR